MTVEEIERKHQEDLRRIRNFRLMDDDFMTKCFEGDPRYIERCILETGKVIQDGSHILYMNGAYRGDTPICPVCLLMRCKA